MMSYYINVSLILFVSFIRANAVEWDVGFGYSLFLAENATISNSEALYDFRNSEIKIGSLEFELYVGYHPTVIARGKSVSVDLETRYDHPIFIYRFMNGDAEEHYDLQIIMVVGDPMGGKTVYFHARAEAVKREDEKSIITILRAAEKEQ